MPKVTKKDAGEKGPNKLITQFYRKSKTLPDINITNDHENAISNFYTASVSAQLNRDKCEQETCAFEKQKLQEQLAQSKEKLQQTKEAISTCEQVIEQKNVKLNTLKDQLNEQSHADNDKEADELFVAYKNDFTCDGLSELRSIGGKKSDDSNFVLLGSDYYIEDESIDWTMFQ